MDANTNPAAATESLAAWAARVAPTLDADGWRQADAIANRKRWAGPQDFTIAQARALLAERDRVAAGLSVHECVLLLHRYGNGPTARRLVGIGLMEPVHEGYRITDFGREIARVLAR